MSLRYAKIKKHLKTFIRLFGVSTIEFETIKNSVPLWRKKVIKQYQRPGRGYQVLFERFALGALTLL